MKSKNNGRKCENCRFFNGNCTHKSNVGIKVKYRQETEFYIKKAEELQPDCKNYAKI